MGVGSQEVRAVGEDGEEEALCDTMVEEGPDPRAGGGETFDKGEAGLGQRDPMGEVVLGVECRGQPVAKPPDHLGGTEDEAIQGDGRL